MARQSRHPGVRQDEAGGWWVDFRWERQRIRRRVDEDGTQLRDREHAERLHRALLHKLETGQAITAARRGVRPRSTILDMLGDTYTVGEACLVYLELSARKAAFSDIDRSCRMWIQLFGDRVIDDVTSLDVELALEKRAATSSNSTANRDLTYLRAAIRKAVNAGKAQRDPTAPVKKLAEPPHRKRWLRPREGVDLWQHLTDPQDRRLVLVIVNTGLRRGNACSLEWAWVDWENELVDVPLTKSGDSQTVPLNSVALAALREQHAQTGHSRWVWLGSRGEQLNARWWWKKRFRKALIATGLITAEDLEAGRMPSFRTHDLRHTFGSRATAAGIHLQKTKELLGHSSVKVTERYSHIDNEHLRSASEAVAWQPTESIHSTLRTAGRWGTVRWLVSGGTVQDSVHADEGKTWNSEEYSLHKMA